MVKSFSGTNDMNLSRLHHFEDHQESNHNLHSRRLSLQKLPERKGLMLSGIKKNLFHFFLNGIEKNKKNGDFRPLQTLEFSTGLKNESRETVIFLFGFLNNRAFRLHKESETGHTADTGKFFCEEVCGSTDSKITRSLFDLGATPMQALRKVLVPALRPGMISGFILSFTMSLDDFAVTFFTRGTIGLDTLSTYIYADARKGGLTPELKPLMTIIFLVILVVLLIINTRKPKTTQQ